MFSCYGCKKIFTDPSNLANHMDRFCKYLSNTKVYPCGQDQCFSRLSTRKTFISHIRRIHGLTRQPIAPTEQQTVFDDPPMMDISSNLGGTSLNTHSSNLGETSLNMHLLAIGDSLKSFYSKVYANPQIPRNTVQSIAEGLRAFLLSYNSILKPLVPIGNDDFHGLLSENALTELEIGHLIETHQLDISFESTHYFVSYCTLNGITYHVGDILLVDIGFEDTDIMFCQIQTIFIEQESNEISFLANEFHCLGFDFHEVVMTEKQIFLLMKDLYSPVVPHTLTTVPDSKTFVTLRINIS